VGDSRVYHFYNGKLVFQTRDHSASQLAVMMGEIKPEEIRFHEARSHVLKAIGQANPLKPEISEEKLLRGNHAFLLCTDGFWEYVTEQEMVKALSESADPSGWLQAMRKIAADRMEPGNDNNTAVVIFLKKI
jgi:serine/threonine protein phosphatase PrpC